LPVAEQTAYVPAVTETKFSVELDPRSAAEGAQGNVPDRDN
jgi:hypothetical protein